MDGLGWDIDDLLKDKGISREEYDLMRNKAVNEYHNSINGLKKERPSITLDEFIKFRDKMARPS